jgi:hypothetical protein
MSFQPYPTRSGFIFLGGAIIFSATAVLLTRSLLQQNEPPSIFILLIGLLAVFALVIITLYWAIVAFKLDYYLNRNGVTIQWGLCQQLIPFRVIKDIVPGQKITARPTFKGIKIAGLYLGWGELSGYGPLKFRTTVSLAESLLVVTAHQTYVISPDQPHAFLKAWQARQNLGPTQEWAEGVRRRWPLNIAVLSDPLTWGLWSLAALICLALLGYICLNYPDLPGSLPVHFNSLGQADRIADKATLFTLPAVGGIVWVINILLGSLFYRQERVAAYLLWSSTIGMQVCLWIAALTITA